MFVYKTNSQTEMPSYANKESFFTLDTLFSRVVSLCSKCYLEQFHLLVPKDLNVIDCNNKEKWTFKKIDWD